MSRHYVKGNDTDRYAKSGLTVEVKNGNFDRALRKWKKKCTEEGIVQEVRDRKQYVKKSEIRRKAKDAGRKRWLRKLRQDEWN
jgi:small subunit ribosomal protein S21